MPLIKPLKTREAERKKRQRSNILLGLIIAIIMIASTIGYAVLERESTQPQENVKVYRNHTFIKTETGWQTKVKISNMEIVLNSYNLPQEVENITLHGSPLLADFLNKVIFITLNNGTSTEQKAAMQYNAFANIALRMQIACSRNNENASFCVEGNLPVKSCDDANWQTTIVILEELPGDSSEGATVNYKNSCLEIKGKPEELLKANDKALFKIFGIIE